MGITICSIYKSSKREEMYLYVEKSNGLKDVPEALMQLFGKPTKVMDAILTPQKQLARIDINKLLEELRVNGFYLQMPPPQENLLDEHLKMQKPAGETAG